MKRVYGWAGVRYVITKFSRMDSLPNFLTHGAPLLKAIYDFKKNERNGMLKLLRVIFPKADLNCD